MEDEREENMMINLKVNRGYNIASVCMDLQNERKRKKERKKEM